MGIKEMDLTIKTKEFEFSVDGVALSLIYIFMIKELEIYAKEGTYYLTRNEMNKLIKYIEDNKTEFNNDEYYFLILDNFKSMNMLMHKNEKAIFRYW